MKVDLAIPSSRILHLSVMPCDLNDTSLRSPAEPSPPPIKEPPVPPENPDATVREPDPWPDVCSEWEIYRARLRSLECREPALMFSDNVRKQIGIDITGYRGVGYKEFDDLLDGILCAYLAYYYWYWGEAGSWVIGDLKTGYVTLPKCRLKNCAL